MQKNYPLYEDVQISKDFKDLLDVQAQKFPNKAAFSFMKDGMDVTVTRREFRDQVNVLGTAFCAMGLRKKHIAVLGDNCYPWLLSFFTVLASDNVVVPVDKELTFDEIMNVLSHSDSDAVFFTRRYEKHFRERAAEMPDIEYFVCFDPSLPSEGRFLSLDELLEKGAQLFEEGDRTYLSVTADSEALADIVYTSGTTGVAKGVMLSRKALLSCACEARRVTYLGERCLSVLPYNHTYEATCGIIASYNAGCSICINESLKTVADNLKKYKPDFIMLVPLFAENFYKKIWKTLEKQGKNKTVSRAIKMSNVLRRVGIDARRKIFAQIHEVFGGELRQIICGGAPIRPEIADFFDGIGITLQNGYGITECSPLISVNRPKFNNYESVGVVLPCGEVRIDDPDENGEGEILYRGDNVMLGYYKNPEATAEVLKDGWFYTGDFGKYENEQLFITGRKKNLIVLKDGKNVYPEEIEGYVLNVLEVEEVVVRSIKDASGAEIGLLAEIYPMPSFSEGKSKEELEQYFMKAIDEAMKDVTGYKRIQKVQIRDTEFPKTTSRKIKR